LSKKSQHRVIASGAIFVLKEIAPSLPAPRTDSSLHIEDDCTLLRLKPLAQLCQNSKTPPAFLSLLSESIATARMLLLVNYRPEYRHEWGGKIFYL